MRTPLLLLYSAAAMASPSTDFATIKSRIHLGKVGNCTVNVRRYQDRKLGEIFVFRVEHPGWNVNGRPLRQVKYQFSVEQKKIFAHGRYFYCSSCGYYTLPRKGAEFHSGPHHGFLYDLKSGKFFDLKFYSQLGQSRHLNRCRLFERPPASQQPFPPPVRPTFTQFEKMFDQDKVGGCGVKLTRRGSGQHKKDQWQVRIRDADYDPTEQYNSQATLIFHPSELVYEGYYRGADNTVSYRINRQHTRFLLDTQSGKFYRARINTHLPGSLEEFDCQIWRRP